MNLLIKIASSVLLAGFATWCAGAPRPSQAQAQPQSLAKLFKQVSSAVAVVRVREHTTLRRVGEAERTATIDGIGSGVLISADGKVVTAAHVVQLADAVSVEFPGSGAVSARVVSSDPAADVALLQLDSVPPGVTRCAARTAGSPRPVARSSTCMPGCNRASSSMRSLTLAVRRRSAGS